MSNNRPEGEWQDLLGARVSRKSTGKEKNVRRGYVRAVHPLQPTEVTMRVTVEWDDDRSFTTEAISNLVRNA